MVGVAASTVFGSCRIRTFSAGPRTAQLAELAEQFTAGAIAPVIDGVYPLADIASAHRAFDKGGALGRQIVQIADTDAAGQ